MSTGNEKKYQLVR